MKKFIYAIILLVALSCKETTVSPSFPDNLNNKTDFRYTLVSENSYSDTIFVWEYIFNNDGTVKSQRFRNISNEDYNSISTYYYDELGRLIEVYRNGELYSKITYDGNWVNVYSKNISGDFVKIATLKYMEDDLVELISLDGDTLFFDYDSNHNVIRKRTNEKILEDFLDYDYEKINTFYWLKSIEPLLITRNFSPISQNIFYVNKTYPVYSDDYWLDTTYYNFFYEFDDNQRVIKITDEKSLIYADLFDYDYYN